MDIKQLSINDLNDLLVIKKSDIKEELRNRKSQTSPTAEIQAGDYLKHIDENGDISIVYINNIDEGNVHYTMLFISKESNDITYQEYDDYINKFENYSKLDKTIYDYIVEDCHKLNRDVEELYKVYINKFSHIL